MKRKLLLLAMAGALGVAAAPSVALAAGYAWPGPYSYQAADGSYPSYEAFSRDLNGVPCGIECSRTLASERGSGFLALERPHIKARQ